MKVEQTVYTCDRCTNTKVTDDEDKMRMWSSLIRGVSPFGGVIAHLCSECTSTIQSQAAPTDAAKTGPYR